MKSNKQNISKTISLLALLWIASGYFFPLETVLFGKLVTINAFSEFYLIPIFAFWRLSKEKDTFQRKRLKWMLAFFIIYWLAIPAVVKNVPITGGSSTSLSNSYHSIGSVGFFLFFVAVLLFGKRADCGWNCTCVFTRETVGFAFRDKTQKGEFWWKLRHLKWIMLIIVWAFFVLLIVNPQKANTLYADPMYKYILGIYYGTIILIPILGHRNICRWLCPWSATWAVLNKIGPYKIVAEANNCINCGICEKECDMGIPIQKLIKKHGELNTGECMGCERCINKCPKHVLQVVDFRDKWKGINLNSGERAIRVIIGLTLSIFLFTSFSKLTIFLGIVSIYLFISGLIGFCPLYMLHKRHQSLTQGK